MNQRLVRRRPQEMISIILGLRGLMGVCFLKELRVELVALKVAGT